MQLHLHRVIEMNKLMGIKFDYDILRNQVLNQAEEKSVKLVVEFEHAAIEEKDEVRASAYYALYMLKRLAMMRGMPARQTKLREVEMLALMKEHQQAVKQCKIEGIDCGTFIQGTSEQEWNRQMTWNGNNGTTEFSIFVSKCIMFCTCIRSC